MPPSTAAKQVLEQALALPEAERVLLVAELAASLPGEEESDPEVLAELERRLDRHRQGVSVGRPWAEVRSEIEARLSPALPPGR